MKKCPQCDQQFGDAQTTCPDDGQALLSSPDQPSPLIGFNPWRVIAPALLLLIVSFGVFYAVQRQTGVDENLPALLPSDPQSKPVESIAPATGEAERDLKPRSSLEANANVEGGAASTLATPRSVPQMKSGAEEFSPALITGDSPATETPRRRRSEVEEPSASDPTQTSKGEKQLDQKDNQPANAGDSAPAPTPAVKKPMPKPPPTGADPKTGGATAPPR